MAVIKEALGQPCEVWFVDSLKDTHTFGMKYFFEVNSDEYDDDAKH
jgi:hypothetical protein